MKFIVCIKQVPDTTEVKVDPETGTIIREGVPSILNPYDEFAINEAIRAKSFGDSQIVVLSMGPPQAEEALRKCLAIGADEAILLSDRGFAGSDTWATSVTLANAIKKIGDFDLIFCGQQAIDGDSESPGSRRPRARSTTCLTGKDLLGRSAYCEVVLLSDCTVSLLRIAYLLTVASLLTAVYGKIVMRQNASRP